MCADPEADWGMLGKVLKLSVLQVFVFFFNKDLNFSFFKKFLAALGLCCCVQAFSSFGELGLLSSCGVGASHCSGFSLQSRF